LGGEFSGVNLSRENLNCGYLQGFLPEILFIGLSLAFQGVNLTWRDVLREIFKAVGIAWSSCLKGDFPHEIFSMGFFSTGDTFHWEGGISGQNLLWGRISNMI